MTDGMLVRMNNGHADPRDPHGSFYEETTLDSFQKPRRTLAGGGGGNRGGETMAKGLRDLSLTSIPTRQQSVGTDPTGRGEQGSTAVDSSFGQRRCLYSVMHAIPTQ